MNNLKRVFSLALTGVMLSGMMVMGASAANFSDSEEIVNQEAVNGCVALNIINGRDDGSYDPDGLVTRAEMAKMIATAMNGGVAPEYGTKTTPSFTDIKGCWAEQYIEYCNNMKIISGRGDGTFDPYGNVTGVEAAKMVLTALGYDAEAFRLVGADWDNNVNYEATWTCDPSLYEDLGGVNMYNPITRDTAAQIIWNGVNNETMTKRPDKTLSTGEVTFSYQPSTKTLFEVKYGGLTTTGLFTANHKMDTSVKEGYITVGDVKIKADLDISFIGEEVKVMFKDGSNGTANTLDTNDTIYGVFPTGKTSVVNVAAADIKEAKDGNDVEITDKVKLDGVEYKVAVPATASSVVVVKNYNNADTVAVTAQTAADAQDKFVALNTGKTNDPVKVILNANGEVQSAYVVEYTIGRVSAVNSTKVTITGLGAITLADNDVYEGIAKDDVVVYTRFYDKTTDLSKSFVTVKKAETVEGKLTGWKGAASKVENLVIDGTTYKVEGEAMQQPNSDCKSSTDITGGTNVKLNDEVKVYLVNGMAAALEVTKTEGNAYALITSTNDGKFDEDAFDSLKVKTILPDGTKKEFDVSEDSVDADNKKPGEAGRAADLTDGVYLVKYAMDGAKMEITEFAASSKTVSSSNDLWNKDTKKVTYDGATSAVATADAVLFATVGTDTKVYNLRDMDTIAYATLGNSQAIQSIQTSGGQVAVVYVTLKTDPEGRTSDTLYGIVTKEVGVRSINGTDYIQYEIYTGETTTVNVKKSSGDTLTAGDIVTFKKTSDDCYSTGAGASGSGKAFVIWGDLGTGEYVLDTGLTGSNDLKGVLVDNYNDSEKIISYYTTVTGSGTSWSGSGTKYSDTVADDVVIIYVDGNDKAAGTDNGVAAFDTTTGNANAILHYNDKDIVDVIIVETSGKVSMESTIPS